MPIEKIPINTETLGFYDSSPKPCACGCRRIVKPVAKNDIYATLGCRDRADLKRRESRYRIRAERQKAIAEVRRKLGLD